MQRNVQAPTSTTNYDWQQYYHAGLLARKRLPARWELPNLLSRPSLCFIIFRARCDIPSVHIGVRALVTGRNSPPRCLGFRNSSLHACSHVESQGWEIAARTLPAARFVAEHLLPMNPGSISVQSGERDAGGCMKASSLASVHVQALVHPRETAGTQDEY